MAQVNFAAYLTVLWVFLLFFIYYVIRLFADRKNFPWHSYPTIFISYFSSLGVLLIVPLDVSLTIVSRRSASLEDHYDENSHTLTQTYLALFVPGLVLGSVILLFQEEYNRSGYFTLWDKVKNTFRSLLLINTAGAVAGAIFFGILVGEGVVPANGDAVLLTAVLISNTLGLIVLMLLLGYGLIQFPRTLWDLGNLDVALGQAQNKAASRFRDLGDASLNVSMAVADVMKTQQELVAYNDPKLNEAMSVLIKDCPTGFTSATMGKVAVGGKSNKVTIDSLAALRRRVFVLRNAYYMAQGKVEATKVYAYHLEDIIEARNSGRKTIRWSFAPESTEREYMFYVYYKPILYRVTAVLCAVLSVFSYLGVIGSMSGVSRDVSIYGIAVHSNQTSGAGILVFVLITLGYAAYVTMWALFQMRIANMMELLPDQHTTANSLSVNSRACVRLATPLAFFYLGWIYENGVKEGAWEDSSITKTDDASGESSTEKLVTAFSKFYQIQVIPIMGDSFNTFFPIVMFCVSALVLLNLINRVLVLMKLENLQFGAAILTDEQLREGKRQLTRHKRTMERAYQRKALRQQIVGTSPVAMATKFINVLFSTSKKADDTEKLTAGDEETGDASGGVTMSEPPALESWCEKKGNKKFGVAGGGWQARYLIIRKPGQLLYFKDANTNQDPSGQVDLRVVMGFNLVEDKKSSHEGVRLDLELADRTLKLRFRTHEDAVQWRETLIAWKDFAIDYGTFFPSTGVMEADTDGMIREDSTDESYNAQLDSIMVGADDSHIITDKTSLVCKEKRSKFSYAAGGIVPTAFSPIHSNSNVATEKSMQLAPLVAKHTKGDDSTATRDKTGNPAAAPTSQSRGDNQRDGPAQKSVYGITTAPPQLNSLSVKPAYLQGWLDKKQTAKMGMAGWQRRYCRIDEASGTLNYYKSDSLGEKPAGTIDLKLIVDVSPYEKDGKSDPSRFNIDLGDRVYKMRASSIEEGEKWISGINEWREHILLNF